MQSDQSAIQAKTPSKLTIILQHALMKTHIALYRLSRGAIGGRFGTRSFLLLTTTGRKSGLERVTPLFYIPLKDHFVVIASNWGGASHPTWWLNLQAHPQGKVENGRQTILVTARTLEGEERAHMWRAITDNFANFATYQQHTTREIPVVILSPVHAR